MAITALRKRLPAQRILIVEDDPIVANTLRMALAVDGHSVELAEDGMKALAMFWVSTYDLVITDFKMSNMDGMELAEAVKQRSPSTPIILITAYAGSIKNTGDKVSNVDIVMGKPWSMADLQAALQKIFPAA